MSVPPHPAPGPVEQDRVRSDGTFIELYRDGHASRPVSLDELDGLTLDAEHLLWIDLRGPSDDVVESISGALGLAEVARQFLCRRSTNPSIENFGACFGVRVVAVGESQRLDFEGVVLTMLCGQNFVVSVSTRELASTGALRDHGRNSIEMGSLHADSFVASLLDGHLASYFSAVSRLEADVERLESTIFSGKATIDCLQVLQALRAATSRLRRMLASHREVFDGLARPNFRPSQNHEVNGHFAALNIRFERAMDMIEHGRDLVVGSFELFSTTAAMATNDTMRVLTFVTVLIGVLAVIAGVLGMNFAAPFFESAAFGFWIAIAVMALLTTAALVVGRWRRWL